MCVANRCDSSCLWYRHRWAWYVVWQWDNRWIFVLKTLFSLTGEVQSANICLKISNREGWRSSGMMNLLKKYSWTPVKGLTLCGALRGLEGVIGLYVNVCVTIEQLRINASPYPTKIRRRSPTSRAGFTEGNDLSGSVLGCIQEHLRGSTLDASGWRILGEADLFWSTMCIHESP